MVEYDVQLSELTVRSENNHSRALVTFVLRRHMEYHVFTTFLQTGILVLTGYITFFFDISDFTNRIMVNLTVTLVVATLLSSIKEESYVNVSKNLKIIHEFQDLPPTSYYKLIDWWMLFCMSVLVTGMLIHTYINTLVRKGRIHSSFEGVSRFKRNTVGDEEIAENTFISRAQKANERARWAIVIVMILFQVVFWIVSMRAYLAGPRAYI